MSPIPKTPRASHKTPRIPTIMMIHLKWPFAIFKGFLLANPVLCPHNRPNPPRVKPFPPKPRFKWYTQNTPAQALPQIKIDPRNLGIHERDGELQIEDGVFVFFSSGDSDLFNLDNWCDRCSDVFVFACSGFFRVYAPPLSVAVVANLEATVGRLILSSSSKKDSSSSLLSNAPPPPSSSSLSSSASRDGSGQRIGGIFEDVVNSVDQFLREALQKSSREAF